MEKKRYEAFNGLRTLACFCIVILHVLENGQYKLSGFVFDNMIVSNAFLGLFLFITISGFGMCCGYYDKFISGEIDIVSFYKKRYAKILPFFTLLCFLDLAMAPSINSLYEVIANLTLCFGLIPNANITVIGVGWFLGLVFTFYFLFPFYCSLLSSKKKAWFTLLVSYIMHWLGRTYFDANYKTIVYCFVYFVAGGIVFLYRDEISRIRGIKWISLILSFAFLLFDYFVNKDVIVILLFNTSFIIFTICLDGENLFNNKFSQFIGGISFEIYLCHMMIFRCVEKAHLLRITSDEFVNFMLTTIIVLSGSVLFSLVAHKSINWIVKALKRYFCRSHSI